MVALLHRGDELRLQLARAQSWANPPAAAPAYDSAAQVAYPAYPYPEASDAQYPATDYGYASGWPLTYWPSVGISASWHQGYAHGRYYPRSGCPNWANAVRPSPYSPQSVSTPSGAPMSSPVMHSSSSRGSGRSGGRSGGRSR
jgi:hypothetical protein